MAGGANPNLLRTLMLQKLMQAQQQPGVQMGNHLTLPSIDDQEETVEIPDAPWGGNAHVQYIIPNEEPKAPVRNQKKTF